MEKKTILALVLSAAVLVGYGLIQSLVIIPKQIEKQQQTEQIQNTEEQISSKEVVEEAAIVQTEEVESVKGEEIEILTDKIKVVLSTKGGDVISYQLIEHLDKETGLGVEMVDNVTDYNRAFSLTLGDAESPTLNEIFDVKKIDDYTYLFYKDYSVKDADGNNHKVTVGKKYTFKENEYVFKLDIAFSSEDDFEFNKNGASYTIRTSPQIGPYFSKKNRYDTRQFLALNGSKRVRKGFSTKPYKKSYNWAGVAGKYFVMLISPNSADNMIPYVKLSNGSINGYENSQIFLTRKAENKIQDSYYIYVGPRSERELIKYNNLEKNNWGLHDKKFNQALQTSGLFSWLEIAIKWCLEMIQKLVKNWGVAIILLTLIIKILLFPLNKNTALGSLKMQEIQPRMQELQAKYKDDQQKLGIEMQKLYKQVGYNPMSGCLPMIIQMIILISIYNVFNNHFEFRGAGFISHWIDDLSVGDSVLSWEKHIPIISTFTMNNLRLLPFIYTGSQLLNGKITQYGQAGGNQGQMKFMMYGMPILFFFLFYNVPSGLLLYWTTSNILQIGQQLVINNITKKRRTEMQKNQPQVNKNVLKFKGGKKKTR